MEEGSERKSGRRFLLARGGQWILSCLWIIGFLGLSGILAVAEVGTPAFAAPSEKCVICHGEQGQQMERSVHAEAEITCTSCHGGVPGSVEKVEAHGDKLRPAREGRETVVLCGGCHSDLARMLPYGLRTDELAIYKTSQHGRKLFEKGDPDVATCVSCHGSHEILRVRDPLSSAHRFNLPETCGQCHADPALMGRYELSSDSPELFRNSVHGVALLDERNLASPGCADCHGSHGATPPRVEDVALVCGHCHSVIRKHFEQSPHFQAAQLGAMEECTTCHSNHFVEKPSSTMFLGTKEGHCGSCHSDEEDGPMRVARSLHEGLMSLSSEIDATMRSLRDAAANGIFIEDEQGYLDEARAVLVRAKPLTHTVSEEDTSKLLNRGMAMIQQTRESLEVKVRSLRDRKILTAMLFLVVLVFVAVLLAYRSEV